MTPFLLRVKRKLPEDSLTSRCNRDGCSLMLGGVSYPKLVIDLDAKSLGIANFTRCDYLFVGDNSHTVCVVPIEFKQGSLSATHVLEQLSQGANYANQWLPDTSAFEFVPILAHRGLRKAERDRLMKRAVNFRSRSARLKLARCGDRISMHLPKLVP